MFKATGARGGPCVIQQQPEAGEARAPRVRVEARQEVGGAGGGDGEAQSEGAGAFTELNACPPEIHMLEP